MMDLEHHPPLTTITMIISVSTRMGIWRMQQTYKDNSYFQPRVLNILMRLLINEIPVDQLETFR